MVFESRFRPVSQGDFDFDEDAMYPSAVRWGAEGLRLATELVLWDPARMVKEAGADSRGGTDRSSTRAASVAPTVDRSRVVPEMPPEALVV